METNRNYDMPNNKLIEIIENQPIINLGCLGSVSDGKSTLVECLTGIKTQRHSNEQKRNITIKQGYGNMKIWTNGNELYTTNSKCNNYITESGENLYQINHISFVDCPGHQELIQTMLSAIKLMDGAIIIVAVDQPLIRKPQLIQHLAAAKLGKLNKIIICMNKIDLVPKEILFEIKQELDEMLEKYDIKPFAIIPTCFNKKIGLKNLLKAIMILFNPNEYIERINNPPTFLISRTFDINKPGTNWDNIVGGIMGGSLMSGTLQVGDKIEIRPGQVSKVQGKFICQPIKTEILSIQSDENSIQKIIPGGLMGIRTDLDPYYAKNDALAGNITGLIGTLPSIYIEIIIDVQIVTTFDFNWNPNPNIDQVMLQIGTKMVDAKLQNIRGSKFKFELARPTCINNNQHIIICKSIEKILRIVGEGIMITEDNINKLVE
jgi:translation initiation factor 2 subunit 3